jgi:hypothetical protein
MGVRTVLDSTSPSTQNLLHERTSPNTLDPEVPRDVMKLGHTSLEPGERGGAVG